MSQAVRRPYMTARPVTLKTEFARPATANSIAPRCPQNMILMTPIVLVANEVNIYKKEGKESRPARVTF